MEELKKSNPAIEIILSFFSPSGYEIRKNYSVASVFYLPADLPGNASTWIKTLRPDVAVFVKYDFWPGYLRALVKSKIQFIVISAHFKPGRFSSWSLPPTNHLLKKANRIFLQDASEIEILRNKGFLNLQVAGDTRIDRTLMLAQETKYNIPDVLVQTGPYDLVAGSTWEEDEKLLIPIIEELQLKVIIAPHDVSESNVSRLATSLRVPSIRLSKMTKENIAMQVVIVDNIGLLPYLYQLGKIAYIGGGFGKGIHNILEPSAHHLPIIFGPKYQKFREAVEMIKSGAALSVNNPSDLKQSIILFSGEKGTAAGVLAYTYLQKNKGATQIITSYIRESIPFGAKT